MVSLKTIAEKCGVSTATVSKALNDQRDISEETKSRVRKTAEALGYFPNAAARALKTNRIDKEVVSVGVYSRVEIWSKDRYLENSDFDDMDEIADHMAELGIGI